MILSAQPPEATLTPADGERSERRPPARTPGAVPRAECSQGAAGHSCKPVID
jgi:hypothetical protein